jgi:ubiquinone biosynthesis protein
VAAQLSPTAAPKSAAEEMAALRPGADAGCPAGSTASPARIEQGRLSLNVRLFADERDRRVVTGLTHQFLLAFLGATSAIVAVILLGTRRRARDHAHPQPVAADRLQPAHTSAASWR